MGIISGLIAVINTDCMKLQSLHTVLFCFFYSCFSIYYVSIKLKRIIFNIKRPPRPVYHDTPGVPWECFPVSRYDISLTSIGPRKHNREKHGNSASVVTSTPEHRSSSANLQTCVHQLSSQPHPVSQTPDGQT